MSETLEVEESGSFSCDDVADLSTLKSEVDSQEEQCVKHNNVDSAKINELSNFTTNESNELLLETPSVSKSSGCTSGIIADTIGTIDDSSKTPADVSVSKNQLKKRRRQEKAIMIKQRKKQQNKQVRLERAKAQGRDIDKERSQQEQARLMGSENRMKRWKAWEQNMIPKMKESFQVCIDCSFESLMTPKEINSLAIQIRYCYSSNKRSEHPCHLTATSIGNVATTQTATNSNEAGTNNMITLNHLRNVNGFEEWSNWGFVITSDSLENYFRMNLQNLVYLTSDSDNTIQELENDKIYVIGGIVDRNRLKRITINRATELGIKTAKLPIDEYLSAMPSTRVLTTNHVFDLLLKYKSYNGDWKKALADVLPLRKDATFVDDN